MIARPIGIDAVNGIKPGTDGCVGPDNCIRVISGIGTPALWWVAVFALIAAAILWVGGRDWRFGIPVVGVLSGWLPWFAYDDPPAVLLLRDRDHPVLGDGGRAVHRPAAG